MPTSFPCSVRRCDSNLADIATYNLQNDVAYSTALSFLVECVEGYYWPPGLCPRVITYPDGRFVIPIPPITGDGVTPIVLQLQGCTSLVSIALPAGSTQAAIQAAAQSVILQVAEQQAQCDAITPPDDPDNPPGGGGGPNQVPLFRNQAVYHACDAGSVISLTGDIPSWLSVDTVNNRLTAAAGVFGGVNQAAANFAAQTVLDHFAEAALTAGALVCACFTTGATLPGAVVGAPYSEILEEATPGVVIFSLSSGDLPAGLELNPNTGEISGTPTTEGTSVFIITATPV